MVPLRCGAGEAGAFHPLYKALQTIWAKAVCASFSLYPALDGEASARRYLAGCAVAARRREYSEELGVELALGAG
jgi:hypothetical protein